MSAQRVREALGFWEAYGLPGLPHVIDLGPCALEDLGALQSETAQDIEELEAGYPADDPGDARGRGGLRVIIDTIDGRAVLALYIDGEGFACPVCGAQGSGQSCTERGELIDDHAERGAIPNPLEMTR